MRRGICVFGVTFLLAVPVYAQTAAENYYDQEEMAKARDALYSSHGGQSHFAVFGERLELQSNDGEPTVVWEGQAWFGDDLRKLWFKTEGEYSTEQGRLEEAEIQALFSRAISPFWDLQVGIRHDFEPDPSRTHATLGVQGLAPYWFELDANLFLSDHGVLSARFEAEYDLRFSQKLLLQPRVEMNAAFSEDEEVGVGSGLTTAAAGLRLRYEIRRELASYVGVSWQRAFGSTRDYQRDSGDDDNEWSLIAGLRFWF